MNDLRDRIAGCLLGGAIGDALGAGIEFDSITEIRRAHGGDGVTDYVEAYGRRGAITDDTQMTLFTVEGIIRASVRARAKEGMCHAPGVVRHAYLRWYHTQGHRWPDHDFTGGPDGWLIAVDDLHHRRAPGNTCLRAMAQGGTGEPDEPINSSKGCGGVMRAAPAGFLDWDAPQRFRLGCDIAALTHGHPSGYLPAGVLAATIGGLLDGEPLDRSLDAAERILETWRAHDETLAAVRAGRRVAAAGPPTPETLEQLGGGWTGEEALAIAIACAGSATSFPDAVLRAVNHSGDSDSTGSITGNLLGATLGTGALPTSWLAELELRDVIDTLADDATLELHGDAPEDEHGEVTSEWWNRYPGW